MTTRAEWSRRAVLNPLRCLLGLLAIAQAAAGQTNLSWLHMPPVPDPIGLAAPFAGVSGGALIVAGGANFPAAMPWEGGRKVWQDAVFVLPNPKGEWVAAGRLPSPLAYGVSVTIPAGVLCAGGSNERAHTRDVFLLQWRHGRIKIDSFPKLPGPMANGCGALVDRTVYLAGGADGPNATNALRTFWALDLAAKSPSWRELEPWPGPARMLAAAGTGAGNFYLFSGVELYADPAGKPVRRYLRDGYAFTPGQGWKRLADLPRAAAGAPSPAIPRRGELLLLSGDDGRLVNFEPASAHPGFPRDLLAYHPGANRWSAIAGPAYSRVTVPVVLWRGLAVIPNGEISPGRRTPEVVALDAD